MEDLTKRHTGEMADDGRTVVARISTTAVDRDGDVVDPAGMDLTDFNRNPVVLFGHDDRKIPVGQVVNIDRTPNEVIGTIKFAERPASHPKSVEWVPDTVLDLFKQGVLRAFSVRFRPLEFHKATVQDKRRFGSTARQVVTKWSLIEVSVVPLPANQEAVALSVSKGLLDSSPWTAETLRIEAGPRRISMVGFSRPKPLKLGLTIK